jgi:predicted RNA-binding Zn-ribbon protein involved in translation (DUF1610 family)
MPFLCTGCGEILENDGTKVKITCPSCGVMSDIRQQGFTKVAIDPISNDDADQPKKSKVPGESKLNSGQTPKIEAPSESIKSRRAFKKKLVVPEEFVSSNEDDGLAYGLTDSNDFYCPGCESVMDASHTVCLSCGFHIDKGDKVRRRHQPLNQNWCEGWNRSSRMLVAATLFLATLIAVIAFVESGASGLAGSLALGFFAFAQILYITGTHGQLELVRNSKGKIRLTRRYFIGFILTAKSSLTTDGHDGIKLVQSSNSGAIEYIIGAILLIPFIFPAMIWYAAVIHGSIFEVALTRDMGRMVNILFRCGNEAIAKEIAMTLNRITNLPINSR